MAGGKRISLFFIIKYEGIMTNFNQCKMQVCLSLLLGLGVSVGAVQAQSGNLEPPGSAVDVGGNPVPTTQTQPSWDQDFPANERFKLVLGGEAVLDKNTGIVWEKSPATTSHFGLNNPNPPYGARKHCLRRTTGGQMGWRLPSIHELLSLMDPSNPTGNPDLPVGHPFQNLGNFYWSATQDIQDSSRYWLMDFQDLAFLQRHNSSDTLRAWCVRGAGPLTHY